MKLAFINEEMPAQSGVGSSVRGRTTVWYPICTHCGVGDTSFSSRKKAFEVAYNHVKENH